MTLNIETVKEQLKNLIGQRDQHSFLFQQCCGAISVLNEQIQLIENNAKTDTRPVELEADINEGIN